MRSVDDCVRAAWQALLRGDLQERDRQVALARNLLAAKERLDAHPSSPEKVIALGEPIIRKEDWKVK